jgi:hypothetical protein
VANEFERFLTWACVAICLGAMGAALAEVITAIARTPSIGFATEGFAFIVIILSLLYGSLALQITRVGLVRREAAHCPDRILPRVTR